MIDGDGGVIARPREGVESGEAGQRRDHIPLVLRMQPELIVRRLQVRIRRSQHPIRELQLAGAASLVDDCEVSHVLGERAVGGEMVPYADRARFTADDAVGEVPGVDDVVKALAREGEGKEIRGRVDVECDRVEDLGGLSGDGPAAWCKTDEGFDDAQKMKGELVLAWREFEVASTNARGKRTEQLEKCVQSSEGIGAIVT